MTMPARPIKTNRDRALAGELHKELQRHLAGFPDYIGEAEVNKKTGAVTIGGHFVLQIHVGQTIEDIARRLQK